MVENADKLQNIHYNIGTGVDISIQELALMISQETGYQGEIKWDTTKPDGENQKFFDCSKIKGLGWVPCTSIREGLRLTYEWYLKHEDKLR